MPDATVALTIRLSREHASALNALAELYHAAPERMVAGWAVHQIEVLSAGLPPDDTPLPPTPDAEDAANTPDTPGR
jgi:hypothetical protein